MSAPDPVVEAVAQALHGDGCPDDPDYGDPCRCDPTSYDREAEVAVAAVRPLIEAEVREAVAREIEAVRRPGPCPPEYLAGVAWALVAAARIARGSDG